MQISGQWQTYVAGPFTLDTVASAGGNVFGDNHEKFDPSRGFIFFSYSGSTTATNPILAIDSVSLQPVLQVRDPANYSWDYQPLAGNTFIPRTCRAYPTATSTTCDYTDDTGKIFSGWKGYCLETDPNDPSTCLDWFPVDILNGESNTFGQVSTAGYSQQSPLFICAKTAGVTTTNVATDPPFGVGRTACGDDPAHTSPLYSQHNLGNRVVMMSSLALGTGEADYDIHDPCASVGALYHTNIDNQNPNDKWPGFSMACDSADSVGCTRDNTIMGNALTATEQNLRKWQIDHIAIIAREVSHKDWWPYDGETNVVNANGDNTITNKSIFGPETTSDGDVYMILTPQAETDYGNGLKQWRARWSNGNSMDFTIVWNTNGSIERMYGAASDNNSGGAFGAAVVFYLKDYCTDVVKVVGSDGTNASWAERLGSTTYITPNTLYSSRQDAKPYASIVTPSVSFDDPTGWDGSTSAGVAPMYVSTYSSDARSGAGYGCASHCANNTSKVCSTDTDCGGGANSCQPSNCTQRYCTAPAACEIKAGVTNCSSQNTCANQAEIDDCTSKGGVCSGGGGTLSQKFCIAGVTNAGLTCSSDADCDATKKNSCDYATKGGQLGANVSDALVTSRLQLLFANAYGEWKWSYATGANGPGAYLDCSTGICASTISNAIGNDYKLMPQCGTTDRSQTDAVTNDRKVNIVTPDQMRLGYCGNPPSLSNIMVGSSTNASTANVYIHDGEQIQLRFNTNVDSQQLPLLRLAIDWTGSLKALPQELSWGFAPKSDPKDPFVFGHTYRVNSSNATQCFTATDHTGAPPDISSNPIVQGHAFCIAQPAIQIQDNWQWCNGGRCMNFPITRESNPVNWQNFWTKYYPGWIVIVQ